MMHSWRLKRPEFRRKKKLPLRKKHSNFNKSRMKLHLDFLMPMLMLQLSRLRSSTTVHWSPTRMSTIWQMPKLLKSENQKQQPRMI
jgi:hypothetical protein